MDTQKMLRGFAKRNAAVTTCPQGHKYEGSNIKRGRSGDRICKTCANARTASWIKKQGQHYRRNKPIYAFAKWLTENKKFHIPGFIIEEYCRR